LYAGKFITFEGIDGCGKSTQFKLLSEHLDKKGVKHVKTREPGGTTVAEKVREIILSVENKVMLDPTELLLYEAARAQHVGELIVPNLEKGIHVLSDRFFDSTKAYQHYGRGLDAKTIDFLNNYTTQGLAPDITFVMDVPLEVARQRLAEKGVALDRLEGAGQEFARRVRDGFLFIANSHDRYILIDGTDSIGRIHEEVKYHVRPLLKI
jgi:dTMP kinase